MQKDNVIELKKPEAVTDLLTEVLRNGAQQLLAAAVKAEVEEFFLPIRLSHNVEFVANFSV